MDGNLRIILHIVFDGVMFDGISDRFDKLEGYKNIYLYNYFGEVKPFTHIRKKEKVVIAKTEKEWGYIIGNEKVDIIYFHGMWANYLNCFKYIGTYPIVIWWCYGMEIYENCWGHSPLLPMKLLKPKTFRFMQKKKCKDIRSLFSINLYYFFPVLYNNLRKLDKTIRARNKLKKQMLKRVDYIFTVIPVEYDMLKEHCKLLKAKPFILHSTKKILSPVIHSHTGNVLLDHSAMLTNNHLDILHALKKVDLYSRKVYFPLSYGDNDIRDEMKKNVNFNGAETHFLEKSIPFEEYKNMLRSCSHAIFGAIRQSGLGNIYLCLQMGVKIFLFEDSILYQYLKKEGYHVFSIDRDISQNNLDMPLTKTEVIHNNNLFLKKVRNPIYGSDTEQFNKLIEEHEK